MLRQVPGIALVVSLCIHTAFGQQAYWIQSFAGSANVGDLGAANRAVLFQPEGIAQDLQGNIFLSDASDHRVRRISPNGTITTVCGNGTPGFSGDDGPATQAQLNTPYGLAVDRRGNLYIADLGNARVRRISPAGQITTIAGGGDMLPSFLAEGSPATMVRLRTPRNLLADPDGTIYVSDFDGHAVHAILPSGSFRLFAGTGLAGAGINGVEAIRSPLRAPTGLALHPQGGILLADSGNNRIRWVFRGEMRAYSEQLWPNGVPFSAPTALTVDPAGTLYIAAAGASVLRRTAAGQTDLLPFSARDLLAEPTGQLLYSSRSQLLRWRPSANNPANSTSNSPANAAAPPPQVVAGGAEQAFLGDQGPATEARLFLPSALASDSEGNLYIADERNHRLRRVSPSGLITTLAGTGVAGSSGDGGPATLAQINSPRGVVVSPEGHIVFSDAGNGRIRSITRNGLIVTLLDGLKEPQGLLYDRDGSLLIAEAGANRLIRLAGSRIVTIVSEALSAPHALALDANGRILVADSGNNRIVALEAGRPPIILGKWTLEFPRGLIVDAEGFLWVSDSANHRLLRWHPDQESPDAFQIVAGGKGPGLRGDGGSAADAALQFPAGLALHDGKLCLADAGNHRVRCLTATAPTPKPAESRLYTLSVVDAATNQAATLVPGLLATAYISGPTLSSPTLLVNDSLAETLFFEGSQLNFRAPTSLDPSKPATVKLVDGDQVVAQLELRTAALRPVLFPLPKTPQLRGSFLDLYINGLGNTPLDALRVSIARLPAFVASRVVDRGLGIVRVQIPPGLYASGPQPVEVNLPEVALPIVQINVQ